MNRPNWLWCSSFFDLKSFSILHKSSLSLNDNCKGCCSLWHLLFWWSMKHLGAFFHFLPDRCVCWFFFSLLLGLTRSSCNKNKLCNLSQCHNVSMDGYQTSYIDRNKDFEIPTEFSETQNLLMDDKVFLVIKRRKKTKHFHYFHHYLQLYRNSLEYL